MSNWGPSEPSTWPWQSTVQKYTLASSAIIISARQSVKVSIYICTLNGMIISTCPISKSFKTFDTLYSILIPLPFIPSVTVDVRER